MKEEKTDKDYWEKAWDKNFLEKYYGIEKYLAINKKLDRLFKSFLERGNKRILEIGCAKGKYLIYFAKEFGYEVYGTDYSEKGAVLAQENLKKAGVAGTTLCQDIFQTTFQDNYFDIVYSMGLIEHFKNPADVIDAHIKLLKNGGTLIITIPNLRSSLAFTANKIMGKEKELSDAHNLEIMDKNALHQLLQGRGVNILKLDYFGPIDFSGAFSGIGSKPVLYLAHFLNQVIGYATFFMPGSSYFSPYLVLIGKKVEGTPN
jgi:2-polyprenyl-3-methyl-5-hydroxy-6-metoxy-1,4-benzoquinol methylase